MVEERSFDGPGDDEKLKTFAQGNKPVTRMADVSDAILRIGKITMAITDCTNKNYVRFNLDPDDALILAHDVLFDRVGKMDTVYQGSGQGDDVQSRRLDLSYDPGDPNDPKKNKGYHLTITNGPGTRMATGGVLPNKARSAEDVRVNMFIRRDEFRQAMALVKARIQAYETMHVARRISAFKKSKQELERGGGARLPDTAFSRCARGRSG